MHLRARSWDVDISLLLHDCIMYPIHQSPRKRRANISYSFMCVLRGMPVK
jgi:hypothetical protein